MDHSGFAVQTERITTEIAERAVQFMGRYGLAGGKLTGTRPFGTATWRGLMAGTPATGADRGDSLQGDATLTYSLGTGTLNAAFTNIQNIDRIRAHSVSAVRFESVTVDREGTFQAGLAGNRIQGGFLRPWTRRDGRHLRTVEHRRRFRR